MRIGAMTNPGLELIPQIHWIGQKGFDYVDLALEPPRTDISDIHLQALVEALGLYDLGIIVHTSPYLPVTNPHKSARAAAGEEMSRALKLAGDLGSGLLTTHYLGGPALFTSEAVLDFYVLLLEELCGQGKATDVTVALENSPRNQDEVRIFRSIFERVPDVGLLLDVGHTHINTRENSAGEFLEDEVLGNRLCHVHISDNDGRNDLHVPLGSVRNGIDWNTVVGHLKGHGYDGTVTIEVFCPDRGYLTASRDKFRALWNEHGK
ncbi:MAG: sugar phosphate isomerase/epimerase family protein [Pseudomonadota bacterium]